MRKWMFFGALWMVACGSTTDMAEQAREVGIEQALSDESLQATLKMLQQDGAVVDLNAAAYEQADQGYTVTFPVKGGGYEQLVYDATYEPARVVVVGPPEDDSFASAVFCGTRKYSDNCNYGPWLSGQGCTNGPLYKYGNYTRTYYTNGRRTSLNYYWYNCSWMAQDPSCTSTCSL